jgi:proteasome lid subunit RPN8/RPN11
MKIHLTPGLLRQIEQHAEHAYPSEGAGVLLGHSYNHHVEIVDVLPLENSFENGQRHRRYMLDAQAMMQAELTAEAAQQEVVGIFHSHPDHPPIPSEYDLEHSLPWFSYIISSIEAGKAKRSRAWRLVEDRSRFEEIELLILNVEVES